MDTNVYLKNLKVIQRIRDIAGGLSLNLPQICVVGDQSSGKSSVLKLITGVDFPVNAGTCTKCAIVVECKQDGTDERYEIQNVSTKEYESVDFDEMANKIIEVQNSLLGNSACRNISEQEIKVKVCGPNMIDIIVVDLPGIINVGEGKKETRALIKQYIEPVETLILLVSEGKQDKELITAVELASEFDIRCERTMHIYTKFDTFDSTESKDRACQWVLNGKNSMLGGHAVVAAPGGKEYSSKEELDHLRDMDLPEDRSGISSLKERLPTIFAKLIKSNLPRLFDMVDAKMKADKKELDRIGETPNNPLMAVKFCQDLLFQQHPQLQTQMSPSIQEFQEEIHQLSERITSEWTAEKFPSNVFVVPFFAGKDAFLKCIIEITEWWKPYLEDYTNKVEEIILDFPSSALIGGVSVSLYHVINSLWKIHACTMIDALKSNSKYELTKFKMYGTLNHYLTSKFEGEMYCPDELVASFVETLSVNDFPCSVDTVNGTYVGRIDFEKTRKQLQEKLETVRKDFEEDYKRKTLHQQQQKRLHTAVLSSYKVESKTFTDLIFKETQKLLSEASNWIMNSLMNNDEIVKAAGEDKEIAQRRDFLKEHLEKMKACLKELSQIM